MGKLTGAASLVIATSTSPAKAASFELEWSAPADCPSRDAIVAATHARLRRSTEPSPPELLVRGTVAPVASGFVVTFALRDVFDRPLGEREVHVEAQSCSAIETPAALVLAMMIAVARPAVRPSEPTPTRSPSPSRPAPTPRPQAPSVSPSARPVAHRFALAGAAVGSVGLLPELGMGFAVRAIYLPRSIVVVGLDASFEFSRSVPAGSETVSFRFAGASAFAGLQAMRSERFELLPLLDVRGGLFLLSPSGGFSVVEDRSRVTMLVGAGLLVRTKLSSHLFAEALPELQAVLIRDSFEVRDSGELHFVHRPAPLEARLSLGLGYEF